MKKILVHSNGPMVTSGYGVQCKLLMLQLRRLGYDVACSAFAGLTGSPITWQEFPIFPAGVQKFSPDVICEHAQNFGADLVLTLMDQYKLASIAARLRSAPFQVACWMPIDCTPLSKLDVAFLRASEAVPIAMSRFGVRQLEDAGFTPSYVPHAVDCSVFRPLEEREQFRQEIGVAGKFTVGIAAANTDALRKAWPEQFRAFAKFHARHQDTLLMVHSLVDSGAGLDLAQLADDMGILESTMFIDQYAVKGGLLTAEMMSDWYGALDVLSLCTYGEGFGVPLIEAQATGTPVIATDASAATELVGAGWKVPAQEFWNPVHRSFWARPDVPAIVATLEKAYRARSGPAAATRRANARTFAENYDTQHVADTYWAPILEKLEAAEDA